MVALERAGVPRDRIEVLPGIMHGTIDEARAVKRYVSANRRPIAGRGDVAVSLAPRALDAQTRAAR